MYVNIYMFIHFMTRRSLGPVAGFCGFFFNSNEFLHREGGESLVG